MSSYGPFDARIGVLERLPHFVDLITRNKPGVTQYRLWGARNINDAYGDLTDSGVGGTGPTLMMTANFAGQRVQSPELVRRKAGMVEESRKGQTSFQFDIVDFLAPAAPQPFGPDEEPVFVRLQEFRQATGSWQAVPIGAPINPGEPILGPTLVVPGSRQNKSISTEVVGIAPAATGCMEMYPPNFDETLQQPIPMHVVFPRPVDNVVIRNDAEDADTWLLVSYGLGQPMFAIPGGGGNVSTVSYDSAQGSIGEMIFACDTAVAAGSVGGDPGCPFTVVVISPSWRP